MKDLADTPFIPVRAELHREPLSILGTLRAARGNLLAIIPWNATRQPMVTGKTGLRWHMVMSPKALRRVLRDRVEDYPKSTVTHRILGPGIGESLFLAEGAHWRWQRRTAAPVFSHRNLADLAPVMQEAARASLARLERAAGPGGATADLYDEMVAVTFDIICNVTLAGGGQIDRAHVHDTINGYIRRVGRVSLLDIVGAPAWAPRPGALMGRRVVGSLHEVADRVVRERLANPSDTPDLLGMLMESADPDSGRRMNPQELRDNLLAFIVAGHETTALALAWALYLLGHDQAAQERARAEAMVLPEALPGPQDLDALPFTRAVVEETMRLYPPAAFLSRTARAEDRLCGRIISPGDTVMLPIYALHRHHMLWEEPDAFRPERFLGPRPERFSYLPFGDGPRICIGAGFAMMEAQIVLAALLRRFRFEADGPDPVPRLFITLRPEGGVKLRVRPI
ncbi:cytochrome P450 [Oceanicella sp. SM1341]|uniref:cytochrome P450 n=1 Tax=Oceanicella sp. SM1341 TaxID=1548889 RepID=UPI000E4D6E2D|nr:cytochrome P450 [Oceanicella sp. SM1341]